MRVVKVIITKQEAKVTHDEVRDRIRCLERELQSLSYHRRVLHQQSVELGRQYMTLYEEKNALERSLIHIKVIRTRVTISGKSPTPLDEMLKILPNMTASQVQTLLSELQGSEEEGKVIEYMDEPETHEEEEIDATDD